MSGAHYNRPPPRSNNFIDQNHRRIIRAKYVFLEKRSYWISLLFWKLIPGLVITLKWPNGVCLVKYYDDVYKEEQSADPNDHYRPYLEEQVGKQFRTWDWKLDGDNILLKLRFDKKDVATMIGLKWS